jgi:Zn-dependent protease/Flp pilus assembly protein TadD
MWVSLGLDFPFTQVNIVTLLRQNWGIKPIRGIPLSIELSCIPSFVLWSFIFSRMAGVTGLWLGFGKGLLVALVLFISIWMHEVCRAIAGRAYGLTVQSITLNGWGSQTSFEKGYQTPLQLLEVSLAGSLFNLFLFVVLSSLAKVPFNLGESLLTLVEAIKVINVTIGLFYLIPGLPLDGEQFVSALLWEKTGKVPQDNPLLFQLGYVASAIAIAVGLYYMSQHAILGCVLLYLGLWTCIAHPQTVLPKWGSFTAQGYRKSQSSRRRSTSKRRSQLSPREIPQLPQIPDFDAQFLACANANERFAQGMHYIENQKFQAAIMIFSEVIQANPACGEGFHNRGNAYLKVGDYTNALEDFKSALRCGLHHSETYLGQGLAYIGTGDRQGGIMAYAEAIRMDENSLRAYLNRGNAYAAMAQYQQAIADYQRTQQCFVETCDRAAFEQVQQALTQIEAGAAQD